MTHNDTRSFENSTLQLTIGHFTVVHYSVNMIVTYACMGIFGILSNLMACAVIISNKSMHTASNCYLFNLAVSDIMILIWALPMYNSMSYSSELVCQLRYAYSLGELLRIIVLKHEFFSGL